MKRKTIISLLKPLVSLQSPRRTTFASKQEAAALRFNKPACLHVKLCPVAMVMQKQLYER